MDLNFFKELQSIHVAAWNEKDRTRRDDLLRKIYADNIKMYDKDFIFDGLDKVSDFIGKLLEEDSSFSFSAAKEIEPLQNSARLYGHITTGRGKLNSMDFFYSAIKRLPICMHLWNLICPDAGRVNVA